MELGIIEIAEEPISPYYPDNSKACDNFVMANSLGIRQLDFYLYEYCGHSGDIEEIEEETVEDGWITRRVEVAPKEYPLEVRIN